MIRIDEVDITILSRVAPMKMVEEFNHLEWNRDIMSRNTNITLDIVKKVYLPNARKKWDWYHISMGSSMQDVIDNPNEPWDREGLSENENITLKVINDVDMPNATGKWEWYNISSNVPIQDVINNPNEKWDRRNLSYNRGLTPDMVRNLVLPNATSKWDTKFINTITFAKEWIKKNSPMTMKKAYADALFIF
jgi:hypothetical protein